MTVANPVFQEEINDIVTILTQLEADPTHNSASKVIPPSGNALWTIQSWAMGTYRQGDEVFHKVVALTDNQLNSRLRAARADFQIFSYKQSGVLRWMTPARFNQRDEFYTEQSREEKSRVDRLHQLSQDLGYPVEEITHISFRETNWVAIEIEALDKLKELV